MITDNLLLIRNFKNSSITAYDPMHKSLSSAFLCKQVCTKFLNNIERGQVFFQEMLGSIKAKEMNDTFNVQITTNYNDDEEDDNIYVGIKIEDLIIEDSQANADESSNPGEVNICRCY
jgi:hypothetical protein